MMKIKQTVVPGNLSCKIALLIFNSGLKPWAITSAQAAEKIYHASPFVLTLWYKTSNRLV
jgi:hypothetical protein